MSLIQEKFASVFSNYKVTTQPRPDARVAERKAQAAKAELAVKDSQKGVQELRQESQRSAQPVQ